MLSIRVSAPEDYIGKIIGELVQMRGEFDTPVIKSGMFTVEAHVPAATSLDFPIRLGVITSGKAALSSRFFGYKECHLELGATTKRRGVNPLDRSKWILSKRSAL
jgi:ribosomal protection tetracycline resistance protein